MLDRYRSYCWVLLRSRTWAVLLLALVPMGVARAAESDAGFVLDIVGTWQLEGSGDKKIAAGDTLPAGGVIVPKPRTAKSRIVVCLFTGEAKTYANRTTLPKRPEPSLVSRMLRSVSGHYHGGIVHAISRGEDLHEAVLPLADGKLELTVLMRGLPAGRYLLEFSPPGDDSDEAARHVLAANWRPETKLEVAAQDVGPGLHLVRLLNGRTREPTGAEALVLVAGSKQYAAARKAFDEVEDVTRSWDEEVRKLASVGTLRACLESLATDKPQ